MRQNKHLWRVLGDFNFVRGRHEWKRWSIFIGRQEESRVFTNFIDELGLIDLPLLARRFTWVQTNEKCVNWLERIFVSDHLLA